MRPLLLASIVERFKASGSAGPPALFRALRLVGHREWIRHGLRERLIRRFAPPERIPPRPFTTDYFGLRYQGDFATHADWIVYFFGAYERNILQLLHDLARRRTRPVFLDVGANVGTHTLYMTGLCRTVHAFEPYPKVRRTLAERVAGNRIENVIIHDVGLSDRDEVAPFYVPQGANEGTGSFLAEWHTQGRPSQSARLVRGDDYLRGLGVGAVDLVKIDVEGFEARVLRGLRETLSAYRPAVVMEYTRATAHEVGGIDGIMQLLPTGYRVHRVIDQPPILGIFQRPGYRLRRPTGVPTAWWVLLLTPS